MKKINLLFVGSLTVAFNSLAEDNHTAAVQLEDISIIDQGNNEKKTTQISESYESFDPLDSGLSVISEDAIESAQQGDIDTTDLLKVLPFVQMDVERYEGSSQNEQSLRPSDFSISGGNYYDNNVMIDGVSVNSALDVTQSKYNESYDEVNGQTAQTLYVDPSLLEGVEVFDSNVSAQYGGFSGGVVNYQVRTPKNEFSMKLSGGLQSDEMVNYIGEDSDGDPKPSFIKYRSTISADLPLTEKLNVLVSYTRTESEVYYNKSEEYGYQEYTNGDTSQNFFIKGIYEINEQLNLSGSIIYSPYKSEYTADDDYNSQRISLSSGIATYVQLIGQHYGYDWSSKISYNQSDTSREWAGGRYKWDADSDYGSSLCDDSYCTEGGFGDIDQTQEDFTLNLTASRELEEGEIRFGSDFTYIRANKERLEDNWYFYASTVDTSNSFICETDDTACMNDIAFTEAVLYESYDVNVGVYKHTLWSEYERNIGPINTRIGLRYDYDNFMKNHNLSPRANGSWEVIPDYFVSMGIGRYYSNNMLAYAIKSATPTTTTYTRVVNSDGTLSDWGISSEGISYDYSQGELNTPYSDEVTLAFTFPTPFEGAFRMKGVKRWGRERFSTEREYDADGDLDYTLDNDGESNYQAVSLEWSGMLGSHAFTANATWSETITLGGASDYFSETDVEEMQSTYLYYDGRVVSEYELYNIEEQQNYAAPFRAHLGWSTSWFNKLLLTKASLNYSSEYTDISDSGEDITLDGEYYDIYTEEETDAYIDVSLNTQMEVYRSARVSTVVDVRISNLLNSNPYSSSTTYQRGRSFWFGVSVVLN